ncbi:MAG: SpoIID/LytB domain-containing protein [Candidatus Paceibacterota bacterium]|jgi:peptidoglycan hydrolase-like amidase
MDSIIKKEKKFLSVVCFSLLTFFLQLYIFHQVFAIGLTYDDPDIPVIYDRASWENTPQLKNLLIPKGYQEFSSKSQNSPSYYPLSRIIIYDNDCQLYLSDGTRNQNCNSINQDPIPIIQGIYRYHTINKKLDDIGYNFIIGWDGRIFEGRYGGNDVVGFHSDIDQDCNNWNIGSIGILLLGNIKEGGFSPEMENSLSKLIGWLAATNNFDINGTKETGYVWQYLKNDELGEKKCDLNKGKFKEIVEKSTISYYKDLLGDGELGKKIDILSIKSQSSLFAEKFNKYLYKSEEDSGIWSITSGERKEEAKVGHRIIAIQNNQLNYFPIANKPIISKGTLFKLREKDNPYLLKDGFCYEIFSSKIFKEWGFKEENISYADIRNVGNCDFGFYLSYKPGSLIGGDVDGRVYLVNQNNTISHITSPQIFNKLGFKWKNIIQIPEREISMFVEDKPILFPTGTIIKGSGQTVYLVVSTYIKPIPNPSVFLSNKLDWRQIVYVSDEEMNYYTITDPLKYPDGFLLESSNDHDLYFLASGRRNKISADLTKYLDTNDKDRIILSDRDIYAYPLGIEVKNKDDVEKLRTIINFRNENFLDIAKNNHWLDEFASKKIKVGLFAIGANQDISIKADSDYTVYKDNILSSQEKMETIYKIKTKEVKKNIKFVSKNGNVIFEILDNKKPKDSIGKKYRGSLELVRQDTINNLSKYWLVNELFLEDYLRGIEIENIGTIPENLISAINIIHRSYALYYSEKEGGRYKDMPFDLNFKEGNILYKGYEAEEQVEKLEMIDKTRGMVLLYNNDVALPLYVKDNCGISRDARIVFGSFYNQFPYLWGGINDPINTKHLVDCDSDNSGVGLSLAGAETLALQNKNYNQILEYYYPSTRVQKVY